MPLIYSEVYALKLERYPLRILLPDREIRQGGVCRGGVTLLCAYRAVRLILFSLTLLCANFLHTYPAVLFSRFTITTYLAVTLFFFALTLLPLYFLYAYPAVL